MQISPISPKKIENFQNNRQLYGPIWGKSGQAKDIKIDKSKKKNFFLTNRQLSGPISIKVLSVIKVHFFSFSANL